MCLKIVLFFEFFLKPVQLIGGTIFIFFQTQSGKNRAQNSKMVQKIDIFSQSWHSCFDHFGVKKHVFWTFQKLFRSCSGSVQALLSDLKGPLLGVFSARKVDKWPLKSKFLVKFCPLRGSILGYFGVKKHGFRTF